jgi:iron complex outermembrane receptor protein
MKKSIAMAMLTLSMPVLVFSQEYNLKGRVIDENQLALPGCHIHYKNHFTTTDNHGSFSLKHIIEKEAKLQVSFIGYNQLDTIIKLPSPTSIVIQLKPENKLIQQILIQGKGVTKAGALKQETLSKQFLTKTQSGTFIRSLNQLPGVNSMDIGSNISKPVIRGLSLNRVVVSENGIKQEGQQWGADHGLEIDPFAVETAEVVKGPSAIEYGSDAIGGYININNNLTPAPDQTSGEINLLGKSVNNLVGISANIETRSNHIYLKARGTVLDFSDYHVPTDTIIYLSRKIPIFNQYLKNTAGKEYDVSGQLGFISNQVKSSIAFSRVSQKTGFFPGSHGIPNLARVQDDHDKRNIGFPFQETTHYKVISNTNLHFIHFSLQADLAFQDNKRTEWSQFHTHYSGQTAPTVNPDLELNFRLKTYQANFKMNIYNLNGNSLSAGIQNQWKLNTIDGYNFFLPEYKSHSSGLFIKDEYQVNPKLNIHLGLRYDLSHVRTEEFYDRFLEDYLISSGSEEKEARQYATRSTKISKQFQNFSWLFGIVLKPSKMISTRLNLGKAFRTPSPIELSANGIHHGSFRHEQGNNQLSAEKGYYADAGIELKTENFQLEVNPYIYYFSNYLYLNPTGEWSKLPHAGQIYRYSQTKAVLSGIEIRFMKSFWQRWNIQFNGEYIRNEQLSENTKQRYPLPFTPPANVFIELQYQVKSRSKRFQNTSVFINHKSALNQNRIAQNELSTSAYQIVGIGLNTIIKWDEMPIELVLQSNNIFNAKYFNHLSFYRKLEIPEPGRNIQLLIKIPLTF